MDPLNLELLAIKTTRVALAAVKSPEHTDTNGIVGWQRWEREACDFQRQRASVLTDLVAHPPRVAKSTDLPQEFCPWESNLKEFQQS